MIMIMMSLGCIWKTRTKQRSSKSHICCGHTFSSSLPRAPRVPSCPTIMYSTPSSQRRQSGATPSTHRQENQACESHNPYMPTLTPTGPFGELGMHENDVFGFSSMWGGVAFDREVSTCRPASIQRNVPHLVPTVTI